MQKHLFRQIAIIAAVIAVIVINILANALPINNQGTGEISDQFQVYFVPAGYVFSIWGIIYLGLIAYAVFQALPSQKNNPRLIRIAPWFLAGSAANIAWIFLWHYEQFPLTLVAMFFLLISLLFIYVHLRIGSTQVSAGENWLVRIPFSIYLGWISVATIANVTDVLDFIGWSGWGVPPATWAVIMLVVATVLGVLMRLIRRDAAYVFVLIWAFAGIALKHSGVPLVSYSAWAGTVILAIWLLVSIPLLSRRSLR